MDDEFPRLWSLAPGPGGVPKHDEGGPTLLAPSAFRVDRAATLSVRAAVLAAHALGRQRDLDAGPPTLDADHALAASIGYLRVDGTRPPAWAELSGCYPAANGRFVQIHANFGHHAASAARVLGVDEDREAFSRAIAAWDATELEAALIDEGAVGAAYRTMAEWDAHPHAQATANLPVIEVDQLGDASADDVPPGSNTPGGAPGQALLGPAIGRPLDSVRVLDCSRVLAGPVCGQTLAAAGADVLRIGAAHLPSVPMAVMATGFGKRNAFIDLRSPAGQGAFRQLVAEADVVIDAYRPGALAKHGFGADSLARLRPGIVVIEISAFDWTGPWAGRRGYDSIVQSTTGLALAGAEAAGSVEPVHLPFQALDFATGYLAAFAAARLLTHRRRAGGSWRARLSLLRTRNWLCGLGQPQPFDPAPLPDLTGWTHEVDSPFGRLEAVRPVHGHWDRPPTPLGSSPPTWLRPDGADGAHLC